VQRQWEFQQMGQMSARILSWGLTSFKSIADAQAMDRQLMEHIILIKNKNDSRCRFLQVFPPGIQEVFYCRTAGI